MPVIRMSGPKLSKEEKAELIKKFTETASQVTDIPEKAFVVLLEENNPDNVGVGGAQLSEMEK